MSKKPVIAKKGKGVEIALNRDESDELQMIVDRLAVQNPEGESFERYLHSLRSALAGRPQIAAALVEVLSRNPNETGFRTFKELAAIIENSPFKRHSKQAGYRFSQKGFTVSKETAVPEKVVLIQGETRKPAAHFFLVQGALWLISAHIPDPVHGTHSLITAFLEDDYESFNVRIAENSTQKLYKDYLQKVAEHSVGKKAYEIPLSHAARLFFEMFDLWTKKTAYAELERARDVLSNYREPERKPYVYDLMEEIENPEQHLSEIDIASLLDGMDLAWLRFSKEDLIPYNEKIKTLDSPLLVVPREVQIQRSLDVVRNAADELCTGKTRDLYRRFFEEQAMTFKLAGVEDKARQTWIIARHLGGNRPSNTNPAVFQLVMYSLKYYWPDEFKEAQEAQARPDQERRTESGIILP